MGPNKDIGSCNGNRIFLCRRDCLRFADTIENRRQAPENDSGLGTFASCRILPVSFSGLS